MVDPLAPHRGLLNSVLDEYARPGDVIRNLLRGNPGAAFRKATDFLTAPIPFVSELSKPEDSISGGELLGMTEPGIAKTVADIGIDLITNPLSAFSFGAGKGVQLLGKTIAKDGATVDPLTVALGLGKKTIDASTKLADDLLSRGREATTVGITPTADAVRKVGATVRNALGWHDLTDAERTGLAMARAKGERYSRAGADEAQRAMKGTTAEEQAAIGDAFDAIHWEGGKAKGIIPGATVEDRLAALASMNPKLRLPVMQQAAAAMRELSAVQMRGEVKAGALAPRDSAGTADYLGRRFSRPQAELDQGFRGTSKGSNPVESRVLETPEQLLDYLQKLPEGVQFERNALRRMTERASQGGRNVERAELARGVTGKADFNNVDDSAIMRQTIDTIAQSKKPGASDWAYRLDQVYNGTAPRGWWTSLLNTANRAFKPAVTVGLVIPRVGFHTKNQLGMAWQALSTPGVPLSTQRHAVRNYFDSYDDALEKVTNSRLGDKLGVERSRLTDSMNMIEDAYAKAKGDGEAVVTYLRSNKRNDLAEAVEHGVMDGFISTEDMIKKTVRDGSWKAKAANILDAPAAIMQGQEQRTRLLAFMDLRDRHGAAKAANLAKEAFLDYTVTGEANRTLRDHIPFAQFMAKSIPQQAKFISRTPAVAVGLGALFGQDGGLPKYDWMRGQATVPLGLDEQGNPKYLTSVGLPVEALSNIPTDFKSAEHLIGQTQPLLKTAYAALSGHDPSFGTPFLSYDKTPITGGHSEFGRYYNALSGTGLISLIDTPIRQASTILDKRRSAGDKVASLLGGMRVASVDPDIAAQRDITDSLQRNPKVRSATSYFKTGEDADVDALLGKLKESKARLKEKREQAKAAAGATL